MEQGRRPEQIEYSAKASFYCILIAFIAAIIFSKIQPIFNNELREVAMIIKNIAGR